MSNQEVWITIRIKSELPVETDAEAYAEMLALQMQMADGERLGVNPFLTDCQLVEVIEVEQEADIYGLE